MRTHHPDFQSIRRRTFRVVAGTVAVGVLIACCTPVPKTQTREEPFSAVTHPATLKRVSSIIAADFLGRSERQP